MSIRDLFCTRCKNYKSHGKIPGDGNLGFCWYICVVCGKRRVA